jgi:Cytochrome C oxidase, cbb3-type, subunit III
MKSRQRVWGVPWVSSAIRAQAIMLALCSIAVNANDSGAQNSGAKGDDTKATDAPYKVKDGNKVDPQTLMGWKTWRALACERCHGAQQEGLVGPALVDSLKVLSKEEFHNILMNGRPEKGMPPFNGSQMVNENWEGLYAYLKGRSDGKIAPGRLTAIGQP